MSPSPANAAKHGHYFKLVAGLSHVDVYRVLSLFNVTDPCLQHAIKKLLVAGGRGAGKDITRDVREAIDTLQRWGEMREEDAARDAAPAEPAAAAPDRPRMLKWEPAHCMPQGISAEQLVDVQHFDDAPNGMRRGRADSFNWGHAPKLGLVVTAWRRADA